VPSCGTFVATAATSSGKTALIRCGAIPRPATSRPYRGTREPLPTPPLDGIESIAPYRLREANEDRNGQEGAVAELDWIHAQKRFRLSHAHVQMARELGMNPKKLGKLDNHDQEPWKAPLPQFIEHLYFKRFGREQLEVVMSVEKRAAAQEAKRAIRKEAKRVAREGARTADVTGERGS